MGYRFYLDRTPEWRRFTQTWGNCVRRGRLIKRRLSKARRRAWKDERERGLRAAESTCSYKGW